MADPSYISENWPWLLPWLLTFAASVSVLRNLYALELTKRALARSEAENEKLQLEVAGLKNPPDARQARREIYDRLRNLLNEILPDIELSNEHVFRVVTMSHDAELWYPEEIQQRLVALAAAVNGVYVAQRKLSLGLALLGEEKWQELLEKEAALRVELASFLTGMPDFFRSYIVISTGQRV